MFSKVKGLIRGQSQETLIKQYTHQLATITSKIHQLDLALKKKDVLRSKWQGYLSIYGSSALAVLTAASYLRISDKHLMLAVLVAAVALFVLLKWTLNKWFEYSTQRTTRKLDKLRAEHQEKLEALKQKTHFYSTNSLIQRFSSGEHQAEDVVTLMDEEVKSKHEELSKLQKELEGFKSHENTQESQVQREKWFDKVLDVISGGDLKLDSQIKPILCSQCGKHAGSYSVSGTQLHYICPFCGWKFDNTEDDAHNNEENKDELLAASSTNNTM
ncbi:LAQU0S22e00914g1_1 [Lachancea quebecensis]|uniref:Endoplasmic reticulum junction formation protein lunapark n=1 Tax=Lachancea quebecensis TaxID=1654605 RepID=A0A0P1KY28_9SACH|nr:LAQU0S22e00914g1_1 [Lachancea quebecensis]